MRDRVLSDRGKRFSSNVASQNIYEISFCSLQQRLKSSIQALSSRAKLFVRILRNPIWHTITRARFGHDTSVLPHYGDPSYNTMRTIKETLRL